MPDWPYVLLALVALLALPFYLFVVSKVWAFGRLSGTREFIRKCKGERSGEN